MKRTRLRSRRPGKPRRRSGACKPYLEWLKGQPCVITGRYTEEHCLTDNGTVWRTVVVDPAHVRVKRLGGDLWNCISLSHHLHSELHQHGIKTFAAKYGVDLKAIAERQTEEFFSEYPQFRPETAA